MPKQPNDPTRRLSIEDLDRTRRLEEARLDRKQRLAEARLGRTRRLSKTTDPARTPKKRPRRHRDWHRILRRVCAVALLAEVGWALFFNPYLRVTKVRVEGAQTLPIEQIYAEARVPGGDNIFWMALRQKFVERLESDLVVDHASRRIELPDTLVLRVWERQPYVTLAVGGRFWLLDAHGVPYRTLDEPDPGLPAVTIGGAAVQGNPVTPDTVALGRPLQGDWLRQTFALLNLLAKRQSLGGAKIEVDQNANLCLNRGDNLQILLGQPESMAQKVALAQAAVAADGGELARRAAYIDVSCPGQPVWKPRPDAEGRTARRGTQSE